MPGGGRREEGWDCGDIVTNDSDNSNQSGMLCCII